MKNQTPRELFVEYRNIVASLVNTYDQIIDRQIDAPIKLINKIHINAACLELWTKVVQRNSYKAGL